MNYIKDGEKGKTFPIPNGITKSTSWWSIETKEEIQDGTTMFVSRKYNENGQKVIIESPYKLGIEHSNTLYGLLHIWNTRHQNKKRDIKNVAKKNDIKALVTEYYGSTEGKDSTIQKYQGKKHKIQEASEHYQQKLRTTSFDFTTTELLEVCNLKDEYHNRVAIEKRIKAFLHTVFTFENNSTKIQFSIIDTLVFDKTTDTYQISFKKDWIDVLFGDNNEKLKMRYLSLDLYNHLKGNKAKELAVLLQIQGRAIQGNGGVTQPVKTISKDAIIKFLNLEHNSRPENAIRKAFKELQDVAGWNYRYSKRTTSYHLV